MVLATIVLFFRLFIISSRAVKWLFEDVVNDVSN